VDRLDERFTLFMDVDRIRAGADFTAVVREAVDKTDVLVAVIGSHWLSLTAENGGRRIDQPGDWVAEEIGTALRRGAPVIPVLVDGANMPSRDELPPALADLANRQALRIAYESFGADSARLIQAIESTVGEAKPETVNLWEDPDYPEALAAFLQGLWPVAIEGFDRVLHRHPRQTHVMEQLEQARRRQRLLDLDATAEGAAEASRWQEAVEALEAITALQPSDEVKDRLDEARRKLRVTELQNVVRVLAASGNWRAVQAADTELTRLDAQASDPDGLASKARAELLQAELVASYAQGIQQLEDNDWTGAESTLRALLDRQANYRDAEALLGLAQRRGRPPKKPPPPPEPPATKPADAPGSPSSPAGPSILSGDVDGPSTPKAPPDETSASPRRPFILIGLALAVLVVIIVIAANSVGTEPQPQAGGQGDEIAIHSCTPQSPLIPANTYEQCAGNMLDPMVAKLVRYNTETAAPELDIAQSVESRDNQTFTVKLNPGYKFHDGTEVKAKNFVDAWNWDAYGPNGNVNSYFFEPIEGFPDLQCGTNSKGEADCKGKPAKAREMSGLKIVDDHTFTIKTATKVSNLLVRLGSIAFAPLPDSFFSDPKAYGEKPIGAGPFKLDSKTDTEIVVSKFADYSGKYKPNVDKVTFRIYNDDSAAYNDVVANNLDFTDSIPTDRLVGDLWKRELPDRNGVRDVGRIATTTYSSIDDNFKDVRMRQALSMAIDRDLINKQIFDGISPPLDGWVSPVVDGFKAGACGEWCKFNPTEAKKLYSEVGGYKGGPLTITVNGDGGHKPWADAACNSIKNTLGLECLTKVVPDFETLLDQVSKGKLKGLFRSGWQMDYPSIENFLAPLYGTGGGSTFTDYSDPKFDAKLAEAAAAKTLDEANRLYQEAESILATDIPTMPMWSYALAVGWSDRVTDVKVTPFGTLDFAAIKVK
jgi:oligopeptide transport system substrate-binding protein